ncbi:MAG: hypothetical protein MUF72_09410 [Elainella sp. Prado103]|nr:hypothetical protein [Elainella sp. Prado103]
MISKRAFAGLISTAAVTGAVLMVTIAPGSSCPFSQKFKGTDAAGTSPTDLTGNQINFNQPDLKKVGIAGAGLAAMLGLYAGGMALKTRLVKQSPTADLLPAAATPVEYSTFPIEVPATALNSDTETVAPEQVAPEQVAPEQPVVR